MSGALKRPMTAATFHRGITALIGCLKNTHPLTPGKKQSQMVASHSLVIGRTGAEKNATNKATAMRIAAINIDVSDRDDSWSKMAMSQDARASQGVGSGARAR